MCNGNEKCKRFLKILQKGLGIGIGGSYIVGLDVGIDGGGHEQHHDDAGYDDADPLQAGLPLLVVPADGLERARGAEAGQ